MTEASQPFPTAIPGDDETALDEDPAFTEACMAMVADDARQFDWRFGRPTLTFSEKWGPVWRISFATRGRSLDDGWIRRVVCWQQAGETDIGLAVIFGGPSTGEDGGSC